MSASAGQYIQLFHVQAFSVFTGPNFSFGKTANQSTTLDDHSSAVNAIDQEKYTFSRTADNDPNPWWELDLEELVPVKTVYIGQHMCKYAPFPSLCYCHLGGANITLLDEYRQTIAAYDLGMVCAMRHVISFESLYNCTVEGQSTTSPTSSFISSGSFVSSGRPLAVSTGLIDYPLVETLPVIPTHQSKDQGHTPPQTSSPFSSVSVGSIPSSFQASSGPTAFRPDAAMSYFQSPVFNPESHNEYLVLGAGVCSDAADFEFIGLRYKCARVDLSGCASLCNSLTSSANHNGLTLLSYGCICHFDSDALLPEYSDMICWNAFLPNQGAFGEVVSSRPLGKSSTCYKRAVSMY